MTKKTISLQTITIISSLVAIGLAAATYSLDNTMYTLKSSKYGTLHFDDFYSTDVIAPELIDEETGLYNPNIIDDYDPIIYEKDDSLEISETTDYDEVTKGNYILEGSDSRYITEEEVHSLSSGDIRLARNEIYARHGRMFNDDALQLYFDSKSWYTAEYTVDEFDALGNSLFNNYEIANLELLSNL